MLEFPHKYGWEAKEEQDKKLKEGWKLSDVGDATVERFKCLLLTAEEVSRGIRSGKIRYSIAPSA